jgi:hypothetical protein
MTIEYPNQARREIYKKYQNGFKPKYLDEDEVSLIVKEIEAFNDKFKKCPVCGCQQFYEMDELDMDDCVELYIYCKNCDAYTLKDSFDDWHFFDFTIDELKEIINKYKEKEVKTCLNCEYFEIIKGMFECKFDIPPISNDFDDYDLEACEQFKLRSIKIIQN